MMKESICLATYHYKWVGNSEDEHVVKKERPLLSEELPQLFSQSKLPFSISPQAKRPEHCNRVQGKVPDNSVDKWYEKP